LVLAVYPLSWCGNDILTGSGCVYKTPPVQPAWQQQRRLVAAVLLMMRLHLAEHATNTHFTLC
jgi:hypothetical protein